MKRILFTLLDLLYRFYKQYSTKQTISTFASFGEGSGIGWPFNIHGENSFTPGVKYIHIGNDVRLGANATIFATRAHLYIGDHTFSGPNITIMTGDHPADIKGRFIADNRKVDIEANGGDISKYDQDIVIDEDVWIGCNVTILKGVHLGRGSIVAAGSVVNHSFPPYSIVGGVPAKLLKHRWSVDDIIEHEASLYTAENRLSKEELLNQRHN